MNIKRLSAVLLLVTMSSTILGGCFQKDKPASNANSNQVKLVYYKLFDNEDVIQPLISQYQAAHPNVTITYRKFVDPVEYQKLLLNELAEGQGPDLFSAPNSWFLKNVKKINPLPLDKINPQQFDQTFVNVASQDLVLADPADGQKKVFGLPLTVDTLALYYNKALYEDALPSSGRPATTWDALKEDVFQLSKKDNSFERFQVSGIAMGRSDNISRAVDILYMLMLQFKSQFYNSNVSKATFADQQAMNSTGFGINPAAEALSLYTSFALSTQKNYSWNNYLADSTSTVKEMDTFAKGKVAMIFGYSYLYEQIKAEIKDLKDKGVQTIDPNNIRVSVVPQVQDPATSQNTREALASYYAETVARTSQHPQEAWDFLMFLSSKNSLQVYNQKTHLPTSRRDLINEQKTDVIYGPFAEQIGFADSFPIYDDQAYNGIFSKAIDSVLSTVDPAEAMKIAQEAISKLLPTQGLIPQNPVPKAAGSAATQQSNSKMTTPTK